jgi:subtilisin family serine protease
LISCESIRGYIKPLRNMCQDESKVLQEKLSSLGIQYKTDSLGNPYKEGEFVLSFSDSFKNRIDTALVSKKLDALLKGFEHRTKISIKNINSAIDTTNLKFEYCECKEFAIMKIWGGIVAPFDRPIINSLNNDVSAAKPNYMTVVDDIVPSTISASNFDFSSISPTNSNTQITVGVVDTGLDLDLTRNESSKFLWKKSNGGENFCTVGEQIGWDFVGNQGLGHVDQDNLPFDDNAGRHGTNIAGNIHKMQIEKRITNVKILPIKAFDANGIGTVFSAACGIFYATNRKAKIINASWSFKSKDPSNLDILKESIDFARKNGVLVVAAAGNSSCELNNQYGFYPAQFYSPSCLDNIIVVSSVEKNKGFYKVPEYANYGHNFVHIGAKGVTQNYFSPNLELTGTSMATSLVSGFAANLLSLNQGQSYQNLRQNVLSPTNYVTRHSSLQAHIENGRIYTYGF